MMGDLVELPRHLSPANVAMLAKLEGTLGEYGRVETIRRALAGILRHAELYGAIDHARCSEIFNAELVDVARELGVLDEAAT